MVVSVVIGCNQSLKGGFSNLEVGISHYKGGVSHYRVESFI